METISGNLEQLAGVSKRMASRLVTVGENRFELLMVELQQERQHILRVILFALGAAAFGLLAGVALTVAVTIYFWDKSPLGALLVLAALYAICGAYLYATFNKLQHNWHTLEGTIDQLRKDRECLEKMLS